MVQSLSINSDSAELIRHCIMKAAKTQRYGGMTDDESLAIITINPCASKLGNLWIGRINWEGKQGDFGDFEYSIPISVLQSSNDFSWMAWNTFDIKEDKNDQRWSISPTRNGRGMFTFPTANWGVHAGYEHLFEMAGTLIQSINHPKTEDMKRLTKTFFASWIALVPMMAMHKIAREFIKPRTANS